MLSSHLRTMDFCLTSLTAGSALSPLGEQVSPPGDRRRWERLWSQQKVGEEIDMIVSNHPPPPAGACLTAHRHLPEPRFPHSLPLLAANCSLLSRDVSRPRPDARRGAYSRSTLCVTLFKGKVWRFLASLSTFPSLSAHMSGVRSNFGVIRHRAFGLRDE